MKYVNHDEKNEVHKMLHKILMAIIQKKKDIENSISNRYGVLKITKVRFLLHTLKCGS